MFDYRNIEAFAMVISEGGFEKASRRLHITQSAVSQRVRLLEEQCGQVLLKRTTPPSPTEAGLPLLHHYRKVKQLEADLSISQHKHATPSFNSIAIAINADSFATWFTHAVDKLLDENAIVLDIHVDDQELTHQLLQDGHVWGCISTREKAIQGCRSEFLGYVRYAMYCTPEFISTWFPQGLCQEAFELAPMARFNRKDDLNNQMFELLLPSPPVNPPTFYLPSTEIYGHFVASGRCYGILPEQQSDDFEKQGLVVNMSPANWLNVPLFWHSWQLKSQAMQSFSSTFTRNARTLLRQS